MPLMESTRVKSNETGFCQSWFIAQKTQPFGNIDSQGELPTSNRGFLIEFWLRPFVGLQRNRISKWMNCPKKRETRPFFISDEGCDDITLCTYQKYIIAKIIYTKSYLSHPKKNTGCLFI